MLWEGEWVPPKVKMSYYRFTLVTTPHSQTHPFSFEIRHREGFALVFSGTIPDTTISVPISMKELLSKSKKGVSKAEVFLGRRNGAIFEGRGLEF